MLNATSLLADALGTSLRPWSKVERYIGDAMRYLEMTMEGKQWTATLYSHIFAIEHNRRRMGPQPG